VDFPKWERLKILWFLLSFTSPQVPKFAYAVLPAQSSSPAAGFQTAFHHVRNEVQVDFAGLGS
jgi:hypothetical protein